LKEKIKNTFIKYRHYVDKFHAPLTSTFFALTSMGFYLTFISQHFIHLGYGETEIGIIHAAYFLGLFIGSWKMERLVYRIGHIQTLVATGSLLTSMILIQSLTNSFSIWVLTRILSGLSMSALYIVIECWMLDHSSEKNRGALLSGYMVVLSAGYFGGQQILYFVNHATLKPFIIAALLSSISVIPVALSTYKLTSPEPESGVNVKRLFRLSPFGATGCFVSGISMSALYSFLPIVASHCQLNGEQLVACLVLGALVMQWPAGKLSDYFDRRKVLLALSVLTSIMTAFLMGICSLGSSLSMYFLIFIVGGLSFSVYPISLTQVTDRFRVSQFAAVTATLLLFYGVGSVFGPLMASMLSKIVGEMGLFLLLFFIHFMLFSMGIYSLMYRKGIPEEDQGEFVPATPTTAVAYELDPRALQDES